MLHLSVPIEMGRWNEPDEENFLLYPRTTLADITPVHKWTFSTILS
ncbi:MAG: hypothetical protein AB3A66_13725 [Nodularia sp. CChRGM 3473]